MKGEEMRSISGAGMIVATIVTLWIGQNGDVVRREAPKTIRCTPGKVIPGSARAKRLKVAGKVCRKTIVVRKRVRKATRPPFTG